MLSHKIMESKMTVHSLNRPIVWAGLFILCLGFHFIASYYVIPQSCIDAAYYHIVAERLAEGKGFTEPFIWHHLKPYQALVHSIDYWQPLGIVFYAIMRLIFGVPGEIGLNHFLWSLLSVSIFCDVLKRTGRSWLALLAFGYVALGFKFAFFISTTDNVAFYAWFGYLLFNAFEKPATLSNGFFCGFLGGLLALTRIEGIMFAGLAVLWIALYKRAPKAAGAAVLAIFITISPWLARNYYSLGHPWPSNTKALFLREYADMFNPSVSPSIDYYLKDGWKWAVKHKLGALRRNVVEFFLVPHFLILGPLWLIGIIVAWKEGGNVLFLFNLFFWFANGLLFTTQSLKGTAFHTTAAFYGHGAIFCAIGLNWVRKWRIKSDPHWHEKFLVNVFLFWFISLTILAVGWVRNSFLEENSFYYKLFEKHPFIQTGPVASSIPIFTNLFTKKSGVVVTSESAISLAEKFNCTYILLDERIIGSKKKLPSTQAWQTVASEGPVTLYQSTLNQNSP